MSDVFWTQLAGILTAFALFLGVLMNIVVSLKNGRTLTGQNQALATQDAKTDTLLQSADTLHKKTAHIEHLVNSSSDQMKATIVTLRAEAVLSNARIAQLTELIVTLNETIATANANIERLTRASVVTP